jgi:hypothetical protein
MNRFHAWRKPPRGAVSRSPGWLNGLLRFALGVAGLSCASSALGTSIPGGDLAQARLDARVEAVRAFLLDGELQDRPMTTEEVARARIAQYWPNWPKWQKWFNNRW